MRAIVIAALLLAGCPGGTKDVCNGIHGTCVALHVVGSTDVSEVDQLAIDVSGAFTGGPKTTPSPPMVESLPIDVAGTLPQGTSGMVVFRVVGLRHGMQAGAGQSMPVDIVDGMHATAQITLAATATTDMLTPDGDGDLAQGTNDLTQGANDLTQGAHDLTQGGNDLTQGGNDLGQGDLAQSDLTQSASDLAQADLTQSASDLAQADLTATNDMTLPPVVLVQAGPAVAETGAPALTAPLTTSSTPGTLLFASVGTYNVPTGSATTAPSGWVPLVSYQTSTFDTVYTFYYPNNPGGITSAVFTNAGVITTSSHLHAEISEWSGVAGVVDQTNVGGSATNTTLFSIASTGIPSARLGLAVFAQSHTITNVATFSSSTGWNNVANDGASPKQLNLITDYMLLDARTAPISDSETSSLSGAWAAVLVTFK
jgi:hypothetical protein